jgi:AcrR family transcriptional regulator
MTGRTRRAPTGAARLRTELTDTIAEALLDELAEHGYGRLSMDAVARRAGVGKSALYRRWSSKQDMTIDVVSRLSVPMSEVVDTGSLRGDIRAMLVAVMRWLDHPRIGKILPDLIAETGRHPALADALTTQMGVPRRERGTAMLQRAIARGELPADLDIDLALDLFAAPVFWRLIARRAPVGEDYLDSLTEMLLRAFSASVD